MKVESPDREPADNGTACHGVMAASVVNGGPTGFESLDDDLRPRAYTAWKMWSRPIPGTSLSLQELFPDPQTEVPLSFTDADNDLTVTGHPDILSSPAALNLPECRVHDWKFGRLEGEHDQQMNGYAFLALDKYSDAERCYISVGRVQDQSIDGRYVTRQEAMEWYVTLLEKLKDTTYRPGRQCGFCPRGANCEAKQSLLRQSLSLISTFSESDLPQRPGHRVVALEELHGAAKIVAKAAENAIDLIRAEVIAAGGQLGNLRIEVTEQRSVAFPEAFPLLQEALGENLYPLLKCSKTDVEKAVSASVTKDKGAAAKALLDRLDAAGAMKTKVVEKLILRKAPKRIEAGT